MDFTNEELVALDHIQCTNPDIIQSILYTHVLEYPIKLKECKNVLECLISSEFPLETNEYENLLPILIKQNAFLKYQSKYEETLQKLKLLESESKLTEYQECIAALTVQNKKDIYAIIRRKFGAAHPFIKGFNLVANPMECLQKYCPQFCRQLIVNHCLFLADQKLANTKMFNICLMAIPTAVVQECMYQCAYKAAYNGHTDYLSLLLDYGNITLSAVYGAVAALDWDLYSTLTEHEQIELSDNTIMFLRKKTKEGNQNASKILNHVKSYFLYDLSAKIKHVPVIYDATIVRAFQALRA